MRAVFRFDASPSLGAGHAYRCMTLAQALAAIGWSCHCVVNEEAGGTVPALRQNPNFTLNEKGKLPDGRADWLIVDHYGLDADWERPCRTWAESILVIDDLADRRHDCDLLLDQTFGRKAVSYAGFVPAGSRVLTGSHLALLRPSFLRARTENLAGRRENRRLNRILVSLGATDPDNHSLIALQAIAESGLPVAVDVVLGSAAPHVPALRRAIDEMQQAATLHLDAPDMAALMTAADLAIGAAGTSTWERCCLGLPSLLMVVAENQKQIAEAVAETGAATLVAGSREEIRDRIASLLCEIAAEPARLTEMAAAAAEITDGRGCDRVGLALIPAGRAKDGQSVTLRLAKPKDETLILEWQSHPTTRRFSRNPTVPTPEEHHRWFTTRLDDPDSRLTLICLAGDPAGVLRLDTVASPSSAPGAPAFEISILISPECRGLGVALEALNFARRWLGNAVIVAEVLPGNDASAALFAAAGYELGERGLLYSFPMSSAKTLSHQDAIL